MGRPRDFPVVDALIGDDVFYVDDGAADRHATSDHIRSFAGGDVIIDRVMDTTTTTGTGTLTLANSAKEGFQAFSDFYPMTARGKRVAIGIRDEVTGDWETNYATLTSNNIYLYPNDFLANAAEPTTSLDQYTGITIAANTAVAPDSTTTAMTITESGTAVLDHYAGFYSPPEEVQYPENSTLTISFYAKPGARDGICLQFYSRENSADYFNTSFTLTGGGTVLAHAVSGAGVWTSASITAAANGYYRCVLTGKPSTTSTRGFFYIRILNGAVPPPAGLGAEGFSGVDAQVCTYLYGIQVEVGSSATAFYPYPHLLERTEVLASSNDNALVSFGSGTKSVFKTIAGKQADRLRTTIVDLVADYGADATGEHSSNTAFSNFTTDHQGLGEERVVLNVPPGTYDLNGSFDFTAPFAGIDDAVLMAYGATFSGTPILWGEFPYPTDGTNHSALIQTTTVGAFTVTLVTPADASKFAVGDWILIAALQIQGGSGYAPNLYYYQYAKIGAIDGGTGVITLFQQVKHEYKSTFPRFVDLITSGADSGGPATIWRMASQDCDAKLTVYGAHFSVPAAQQIYLNFRDLTFIDCTFGEGVSVGTGVAQSIKFENCSFVGASWELDKLVESLSFINCNLGYSFFLFQSPSPDHVLFDNCDLNTMLGCGKNLTMRNCRMFGFTFGNRTLSQPENVVLENCLIKTVDNYRGWNGGFMGIDADTTFDDGIITTLKTGAEAGIYYQAVPGAKWWVQGQFAGQAPPYFEIIDVTESNDSPAGEHIDIHTTATSINLAAPELHHFNVHPCPRLTVTNCYGCPEIVALSNAPDDTPYQTYYCDRLIGDNRTVTVYAQGELVSYRINVVRAYTGAAANLRLNATGLAKTNSTYTTTSLTLTIDVTVAGERVIAPGGNTGSAGADSLPSVSAGELFNSAAEFGHTLTYSASIAGDLRSEQPIVEIELLCNQVGVANRRLG